jgi:O-antigen ligase
VAVGTTIAIYITTRIQTSLGSYFIPYAQVIGFGTLFVGITTAILISQRVEIRRDALALLMPMLGLFLLALISATWSQYPQLTLQRSLITFFVPIGLFFAMASDPNPSKTFQSISLLLFLFAIVFSGFGVVIYFLGDPSPVGQSSIQVLNLGGFKLSQNIVGPQNRISSVLYNPNTLAGFLVVTLPISIGLFFRHRSWLYLGGTGIQLVAILLTLSRTGIIAATAGSIVIVGYSLRKGGELTRYIFQIAGVLVLVIIAAVASSGLQRLTSYSLGVRGETWKALFSAFLNHPFVGVGWGVSNNVVLQDRPSLATSTHSDYFTVLSELGLSGSLLFISVLVIGTSLFIRNYLYAEHYQHRVNLMIAGAIFVALSIHGLAESTMLRPGFRQVMWGFSLAYLAKYRSLS